MTEYIAGTNKPKRKVSVATVAREICWLSSELTTGAKIRKALPINRKLYNIDRLGNELSLMHIFCAHYCINASQEKSWRDRNIRMSNALLQYNADANEWDLKIIVERVQYYYDVLNNFIPHESDAIPTELVIGRALAKIYGAEGDEQVIALGAETCVKMIKSASKQVNFAQLV